MAAKVEAWQSGPVAGVPALLQPVAHALMNCREQLVEAIEGLSGEQLRTKPSDVASIEFHVRHAIGSLDRLFTYARGESLSDEQREYLAAEKAPSSLSSRELASNFDVAVEKAVTQLRATDESSLTDAREVGRARLPSTVIGLLFHGAEHTARHTGQIVTMARLVRSAQET
jgi:uncharacterized damage-inducible protein DinB